MKRNKTYWKLLSVMVVLSLIMTGCEWGEEEESDPTKHFPNSPSMIQTKDVTSIRMTPAVSGGSIIWPGRSPITAKGVYWSTSLPITDSNKTEDGSGQSSFTSTLTGLTQNTTYYVKAYAISSLNSVLVNKLVLKQISHIFYQTFQLT